ncbi:hypothetical protein FOCG_11332 [Fusarium oxysporum f. sp. radicis-lycopersici 26381]|uniref:Uncharacterized protein n=3 Tax=Fusarium oxysporum TaxID=5507 RepID=A0A4Q2W5V1_FUSOX|nr:uncharacterized protein FOBCDRAFT_214295 [Fusarium oxysporum Fo47]EWZ84836.1 hypothetical protein FOWG_12535 [Fusarium oxysporum f. sp. lycopersici MN25]EXL47070.1 hypothetical protein FOCG_11332 [Fusarium oxysporum f. sp. radicis-lycopersici 26381]KAJ4166435.1 hypothetical protein NW765_007673 [Fusarium oxysporum]RKK24590.1 hypothetical protein BFJ65_g2525 [Fusarium oxysporum f. sp. cepae]RYC95197.1 hypothetical protein BFJ63_vAg1882 [Fusarium oxysporum f. sp. narcissi]
MGNFGTAVNSLLGTYTKCLSLLKGFPKDEDAGTLSETRSTLSTSLRSDRARVRREYASRLSQDGSRFEKGDAPARSALRRIVRKLTNTLADVVRSFQDPKGQPINCESLLALSTGSSLDAVRAMNDLSSRVGSTSSSSSRGSIVSRGRQRSRCDSQKTGIKSKRRSTEERSKREKTRSKKPTSQSQSRSRRRTSSDRLHRQHGSRSRQPPEIKGPHNRVSIVTIASDSTKLGEIRRRLSKQMPLEEYENRVAYPLYAYHAQEAPVRKKWWNPFRRS